MKIGSLRAACFGTRRRTAATVLVSVAILVAGAFVTGTVGAPTVEAVDSEFGAVDEETTEIRTDVHLYNPNPIGAGSGDLSVEYAISLNGIEMAGGGDDDVAIAPGESTESFTTEMRNDRIPEWWVTHVENGEETRVVVDATVTSGTLDRSTTVTEERTVETGIASALESNETQRIVADDLPVGDPFLYVNATRASWGDVDAETTELPVRFDVYNPQSYDVPVTQLEYTIYMNDVVVGDGESEQWYLLRSGEETTAEATTEIDNRKLDDWWVTHVENDEVSDLRIEFAARVEGPGGFSISLPLDALTYEEAVETDLLGNEDGRSGAAGAEERTDTVGEDGRAHTAGDGGDVAGGKAKETP